MMDLPGAAPPRAIRHGSTKGESQLGRTTQWWDVMVRDDGGWTLALFRCTQLILR